MIRIASEDVSASSVVLPTGDEMATTQKTLFLSKYGTME